MGAKIKPLTAAVVSGQAEGDGMFDTPILPRNKASVKSRTRQCNRYFKCACCGDSVYNAPPALVIRPIGEAAIRICFECAPGQWDTVKIVMWKGQGL